MHLDQQDLKGVSELERSPKAGSLGLRQRSGMLSVRPGNQRNSLLPNEYKRLKRKIMIMKVRTKIQSCKYIVLSIRRIEKLLLQGKRTKSQLAKQRGSFSQVDK